MSLGKVIVGGVIGGLIGAAAWAAVVFFTNREFGLVAWAVGGLVGAGVRLGAKGTLNIVTGVAAAIIAVASIAGGKFAVVEVLIRQVESDVAQADEPMVVTMPDDEGMIGSFADAIAEEKLAAGETLAWPEGMTLEDATDEADYPPALWKDAKIRWEGLPPTDREARRTQRFEFEQSEWASIRGRLRSDGFVQSFGLWDLLWVGFATMTAFSMGARESGGSDDD